MICTSVVPCLSSGLANYNKMMSMSRSMFVLFSRLFCHSESLAFCRKWEDKPYTKAVKQDVLVNFLKDTAIK